MGKHKVCRDHEDDVVFGGVETSCSPSVPSREPPRLCLGCPRTHENNDIVCCSCAYFMLEASPSRNSISSKAIYGVCYYIMCCKNEQSESDDFIMEEVHESWTSCDFEEHAHGGAYRQYMRLPCSDVGSLFVSAYVFGRYASPK